MYKTKYMYGNNFWEELVIFKLNHYPYVQGAMVLIFVFFYEIQKFKPKLDVPYIQIL